MGVTNCHRQLFTYWFWVRTCSSSEDAIRPCVYKQVQKNSYLQQERPLHFFNGVMFFHTWNGIPQSSLTSFSLQERANRKD